MSPHVGSRTSCRCERQIRTWRMMYGTVPVYSLPLYKFQMINFKVPSNMCSLPHEGVRKTQTAGNVRCPRLFCNILMIVHRNPLKTQYPWRRWDLFLGACSESSAPSKGGRDTIFLVASIHAADWMIFIDGTLDEVQFYILLERNSLQLRRGLRIHLRSDIRALSKINFMDSCLWETQLGTRAMSPQFPGTISQTSVLQYYLFVLEMHLHIQDQKLKPLWYSDFLYLPPFQTTHPMVV